MSRVLTLLLMLFSPLAHAVGTLYVHGAEDAVHLRWNAPLAEGYRGFHVERKAADGDWQRVTAQPVVRIKDVGEIRKRLGTSADALLTFFDPKLKTLSDADFSKVGNDEYARNFIELFAVKNPEIARVLGEVHVDRELVAGTSFHYRIILIPPSGGETPWAQTETPVVHGKADALPVPAKIAGKAEDGAALVNWQHQPEQSRAGRSVGYHVYRAEKAFGPFVRASETLVPTAIDGKLPDYLFADRYLENGTTYWYHVRTVDLLGFESAPSETIDITPKDMQPPPPPTQLKARMLIGKTLLTWSPAVAPDLDGYRVYQASESSQGPFQPIWPNDGTSVSKAVQYLDESIREGQVLWYYVTAVDKSGNESRPSELVELFKPDTTPPAKPTGVKAVARDDGIHLSWSKNNDADLAGYFVQRSTDIEGKGKEAQARGEFFALFVDPLTATAYMDPVPQRSQSRYAYRVIAVDKAANRSAPSEVVISRMRDTAPPSRPALSRIALVEDRIALNWQASVEDDIGGYHVYRAEHSDKQQAPARLTAKPLPHDQTEFADKPPKTDTVYQYQLTAVDDAGNESQPSFPLSVRYMDIMAPKPPELTAKVLKNGIELSWQPVTGGDIEGLYLFRQGPKDKKARLYRDLPIDSRQLVDTDVTKDHSYSYYLRVLDKKGNASKPGKAVTVKFQPPAK